MGEGANWDQDTNSKQEPQTDESISRCDEIIENADREARDNLRWANSWGTLNIILGILVPVSSVLSIGFVFSDRTNLAAFFSFISAILAPVLAFLKPSSREESRRTKSRELGNFVECAKNIRLEFRLCQDLSLEEKIEAIKQLTSDLGTVKTKGN